MALSRSFVEAHIVRWETALSQSYHPYRTQWPRRLFHHAPIENAVKILKDGNLRSRRDPNNTRSKDIAAAGVIDNRDHAHNFARLYFRPKTPTQYHIEGIRKPGDCKYGDETHAPVLIMLVFKARKVLVREGVHICDRNMQNHGAEMGNTEEYFSSIPFDKVYHEGATGHDRSITNHRCAEVLSLSPLPLEDTLECIYCRSAAERNTLLPLLGAYQQKWSKLVLVSNDLLLFQREFAFVEDVALSEEGLFFQLNPRQDWDPVDIHVRILNEKKSEVLSIQNSELSPHSTMRWLFKKRLLNGIYLVEIKLEGHLAHKAFVSLDDNPF